LAKRYLLEGLREGAAWKRGEIALPVRIAPSLAADRVKAMRVANPLFGATGRAAPRRGLPLETLDLRPTGII
jgi:hypothetical protein